jgi:hypothetical protein
MWAFEQETRRVIAAIIHPILLGHTNAENYPSKDGIEA